MASTRPAQNQQIAQQGPRQRILRIGILLAGKLVEERLIRERTPVSIGQSMKNTFSIPIEGLPMEFTLFALDEGRYSLRFLSKMDGRLSDSGGQVNTLDALKTKGATHTGEYYQVGLNDSARGKLSMGDLTILFQFVTEPPRQPKPMLPASVRGTFADRFDPQLSVIMGASIIAHFAIVIIALIGDVDKKTGLIEQAYEATFSQDEYALEQDKPKLVPTEPGPGAGSAAAKKEEPKLPVVQPKITTGPAAPPGRPAENRPSVSDAEAQRLAELLTGVESKDGKGVDSDLNKRQPGGTLKQQADDVKASGGKVAIGNPGGVKSRTDGGGSRIGTTGGTKIDAPGGIASAGGGKTGEQGPTGRITTVGRPQTGDQSTLTADAVLAKINSAYMGGIQRCYQQHLNKEATAAGRVVLSLPINPSGRVVGGSASGFAGDVDGCITGLMGLWSFPPPKDKESKEGVEVTFQVILQLLPT